MKKIKKNDKIRSTMLTIYDKKKDVDSVQCISQVIKKHSEKHYMKVSVRQLDGAKVNMCYVCASVHVSCIVYGTWTERLGWSWGWIWLTRLEFGLASGVGDGQGGGAWHTAAQGIAKSWTWLSDWTELMLSMKNRRLVKHNVIIFHCHSNFSFLIYPLLYTHLLNYSWKIIIWILIFNFRMYIFKKKTNILINNKL